jgi:hypothetical protein
MRAYCLPSASDFLYWSCLDSATLLSKAHKEKPSVPLTQRVISFVAVTVMVMLSAAPVMAHGYSGAWPVTITGTQFDNGTGCLTLTGSARSGSATLVFGGTKYPYGSFIVMNGIFVGTITEPLYGQNGALLFIAPASRGRIGVGDFEDARGGSNFQFGTLTFGAKNGC